MTQQPSSSSKGKPLHEYPSLTAGGTTLSHYGVDTLQFNALCWIADDVVLMPAGKFLLFVNVRTGKVESQEGPIEGGIGTVAVHPSRKFFVVGERSPDRPRLLVHEWPSRKQVGQFEGAGCTLGYAACTFNRDGTRVATVAAAPDYTLAVWDWETRTIALRSKSFSSDVYTVCFSAFDSSLLVTGGSGHIKFWCMADTFTGLKLQGTLGKFGRLEISNVSGFAVLPDGKVLSGSESGCLLLWEGDLVKCSFVRSILDDTADDEKGFVPCHAGAINAVALVHDAKVVVTFGDDGWIRYWRREELELAEGDGVPALYAPTCLAEVCVAAGSALRSATLAGGNEWVLMNSRGAVETSPLPSLEDCLARAVPTTNTGLPAGPLRFNGGGITCCVTSPVEHTAVTGGEDGVVRLINYVTGEELANISWPSPSAAAGPQEDGSSSAPAAAADHTNDDGNINDNGTAAVESPATASVTTVSFFTTDATHSRLVAGFEDGTVRLLQVRHSPAPGLALLGQWKPHTSDLFATVLDNAERQLCTVARDGTTFFFTVAPSLEELQPIGFCRLPLPEPTCADWDEEGGGCFVGFAGGQVLSIRAPAEAEVDQTATFEFTCDYSLLGIRQRRLPPPIPEDEKQPEDDDEDILEEKDDGPWPIALLRTLADGSVAIGMRKAELLYRYQGSVRYPGALALPPLPPTGVEPPNYVEDPAENLCYRDAVPQSAFLGPSGKELLVVCDGARVVVREAAGAQPLWSAAAQATVSLVSCAHDSTRGRVTAAQTSFDGAVVVTAGTDGLLVAQVRAGRKAPKPTPPAPAPAPVAAATADASQAPTLSIQGQKEADDEARERAEREEKRSQFLATALRLQASYAELAARNEALPKTTRLTAEEMRLDATLEERLQAERARRVEEARKEYAVESAREALRTKKLHKRFVASLLYDRFQVHAFRGGFSVASFRTPNPSTAIASLQAQITTLDASDGSDAEGEGEEGGAEGAAAGRGSPKLAAADAAAVLDDGLDDANASLTPTSAASRGEEGKAGAAAATAADASRAAKPAAGPGLTMKATVKQQLQKADERREERQTRRDGYAALLAAAPDPAEDEAALAEMEKRDLEERGECVLRSDPHYKGRRDFRPTASAKLHRMIALEQMLVAKRSEFNERLLAVREKKRAALKEVNRIRAKIRDMNEDLGDAGVEAASLAMQPSEEPEKVFEIDCSGLDAFAKQKAAEKLREDEAKKAQRGFGADLAEAPQQQRSQSIGSKAGSDDDVGAFSSRRDTFGGGSGAGTVGRGESRAKGSRNTSRPTRGSRQSMQFLSAANRGRMEVEMRVKLENIKLSEVEEEELAMRHDQLAAERRRQQRQAEDVMLSFDEELYALFREHADVDADLCLGDVHLLLLFREFQMLLVFRTRDRELRKQLQAAKSSREATRAAIQRKQVSLKECAAAMAQLQERLRLHKRDAEAYIQETGPADRIPYLLRIFNRHIKRRKNVDDGDDNDDITSDDEDEDCDDGDSDIGEELCPPNCEPEVWARVLALREERLDFTDDLAANRKRHEGDEKELGQGNTALEGYSTSVKECLARIDELENEKRRQLNLLSTVVPLRCSQVTCLDETQAVPAALWDQPVVVLSDEELRRLAMRIIELAEQKESRRDAITGMSAELQRLQAERANVQKVHAGWEAQVHEVMMLKFGRHIDLEMLESCGTSRRIEAKKEELRLTELRWDREVRKRENQIAALRDELQNCLLHNTHLLQDLGDYEGERQVTERTLAKASATAMQKFRGSQVATKADRANLRELIAAQQEEMDALNAEIVMLRRKGGHAYSPATTY